MRRSLGQQITLLGWPLPQIAQLVFQPCELRLQTQNRLRVFHDDFVELFARTLLMSQLDFECHQPPITDRIRLRC